MGGHCVWLSGTRPQSWRGYITTQKYLRHTIRSVRTDSFGCKLTQHLLLASGDIAITNIYPPNSRDAPFFQDMVSWILQAPETLHLVGMDFNSVICLSEDRTRERPPLLQDHTFSVAGPTPLAQSISSVIC